MGHETLNSPLSAKIQSREHIWDAITCSTVPMGFGRFGTAETSGAAKVGRNLNATGG